MRSLITAVFCVLTVFRTKKGDITDCYVAEDARQSVMSPFSGCPLFPAPFSGPFFRPLFLALSYLEEASYIVSPYLTITDL